MFGTGLHIFTQLYFFFFFFKFSLLVFKFWTLFVFWLCIFNNSFIFKKHSVISYNSVKEQVFAEITWAGVNSEFIGDYFQMFLWFSFEYLRHQKCLWDWETNSMLFLKFVRQGSSMAQRNKALDTQMVLVNNIDSLLVLVFGICRL